MRIGFVTGRIELQDGLRAAVICPQVEGTVVRAADGIAEPHGGGLVELEDSRRIVSRRKGILRGRALHVLELLLPSRLLLFVFVRLVSRAKWSTEHDGSEYP